MMTASHTHMDVASVSQNCFPGDNVANLPRENPASNIGMSKAENRAAKTGCGGINCASSMIFLHPLMLNSTIHAGPAGKAMAVRPVKAGHRNAGGY
jgi:hypothetical protein